MYLMLGVILFSILVIAVLYRDWHRSVRTSVENGHVRFTGLESGKTYNIWLRLRKDDDVTTVGGVRIEKTTTP